MPSACAPTVGRVASKVDIAGCLAPVRPPSRARASLASSFSLPPSRQRPGTRTSSRTTAREWWALPRPGIRVARRNALVGVLGKPRQFAGRAGHEWTGQVSREVDGPLLSAQYRLMIRTDG